MGNMLGENLRFQLGNLTVAVGIALGHRFIKRCVRTRDDVPFVFKYHRNNNCRRAFRLMPAFGQLAQCLVKNAGGGVVFKFHPGAFRVPDDG